MAHPTGSEWQTSDPEEIRLFQSDPLCGNPFSNEMTYSVTKGFHDLWLAQNESRIPAELPVLIIAGTDDPSEARPSKIQGPHHPLHERGPPLSLEYRFYNGGRREIFNEAEKDNVHRDMGRARLCWASPKE